MASPLRNSSVSSPILEGEISDDGIIERLSEVEASRVSGVLRFASKDTEGEVRLVAGQIAADQPAREDGVDAVEVLLELRGGSFEVFQQLPPLAITRGDDLSRSGSLEVHVPADLMNYCEQAGLTGLLKLEDGEKRAEIVYERGELGSIKLDGADDLHEVFGWEEGSFAIEARTLEEIQAELTTELDPEEDPVGSTTREDNTSKHFLRVVEVTLSEILHDREEHRPASRTGPGLPKMEPLRHETLPPKTKAAPRTDQTVRVIYLGASARPKPMPAGRPGKTRHVSGGSQAEIVLPEAKPERRSKPEGEETGPVGSKSASESFTDTSSKPQAGPSSNEEPNVAQSDQVSAKPGEHTSEDSRGLPGVVWAAVALVVAVAALWLLSMLPALQ